MPQMPAGIFRILQGETIAVDLWSNIAVAVGGSYQVVYDDGTTDRLVVDKITTGSSRTRQTADCNEIAQQDGWVISGDFGLVGPDALTAVQRGQLYAFARITKDPDQPLLGKRISSGYVWTGSSLPLGVYIEPGPAGGPGHVREITVVPVAAGGSGGTIVVAVPAGAIWQWILGALSYVADATVGARSVRYRFRDPTGKVYGRSLPVAPTASSTSVCALGFVSQPPSSGGTTQTFDSGGAFGTIVQPPTYAIALHDLFVVDNTNTSAAGDTIALEASIMEWVVPN